jgi:hypothetical protein
MSAVSGAPDPNRPNRNGGKDDWVDVNPTVVVQSDPIHQQLVEKAVEEAMLRMQAQFQFATSALRSEVTALTAQVKALQTEKSADTDAIKALGARIITVETHNGSLEAEVKKLTEANASAAKKQAESDAGMQALQDRVKELAASVTSKDDSIVRLEREKKQLEADKKAAEAGKKDAEAKAKTDVAQVNDQMQTLKADFEVERIGLKDKVSKLQDGQTLPFKPHTQRAKDTFADIAETEEQARKELTKYETSKGQAHNAVKSYKDPRAYFQFLKKGKATDAELSAMEQALINARAQGKSFELAITELTTKLEPAKKASKNELEAIQAQIAALKKLEAEALQRKKAIEKADATLAKSKKQQNTVAIEINKTAEYVFAVAIQKEVVDAEAAREAVKKSYKVIVKAIEDRNLAAAEAELKVANAGKDNATTAKANANAVLASEGVQKNQANKAELAKIVLKVDKAAQETLEKRNAAEKLVQAARIQLPFLDEADKVNKALVAAKKTKKVLEVEAEKTKAKQALAKMTASQYASKEEGRTAIAEATQSATAIDNLLKSARKAAEEAAKAAEAAKKAPAAPFVDNRPWYAIRLCN